MGYIPEERETHITKCEGDEQWYVETRERKIINMLSKKKGFEPVNVEKEDDKIISCGFYLDLNRISFRKFDIKEREYTEEQKKANARKLAEGRANKKQI